MTDLSITNAKLVLPSGEHGSGGVRCSGDRIEAVGDVETCSDAFDAKGAILAPAIVDLGVFAIDKPAFHFGGIARAALMPDGEMLDAPAPVRFAARSGKPDLWVHPIAAATGIEINQHPFVAQSAIIAEVEGTNITMVAYVAVRLD